MEGSKVLYGHNQNFRSPRILNSNKDSLINYSMSIEKKLNLSGTFDNSQIYDGGVASKFTASRVPRESLRYIKDFHAKNSRKFDTLGRAIFKIIDKSDIEEIFLPKSLPGELQSPPNSSKAQKTYRRTSENPSSSRVDTEENCPQNYDNQNKITEKKQGLSFLGSKFPKRKVPARFLPVHEIKNKKRSPSSHLPAVSVKNDLKLLTENNYENLYKEFLYDKSNRKQKYLNPGILKKTGDDNWGWKTPVYSSCEEKTVKFDNIMFQ
ncbi:hypothetical protein SteCoe_18792 [Stentor coeruleus]|uniref:Uncharacterized protein n=1 Tax=Stentor coeruleus TaxID=5963 RepID=A0A1R2BVK3_9CILI|nr:hypothetical protein SteCoe_18792 [Stentor coeruleus]